MPRHRFPIKFDPPFEKVAAVLEKHQGSQTDAARELKVARTTLIGYLARHEKMGNVIRGTIWSAKPARQSGPKGTMANLSLKHQRNTLRKQVKKLERLLMENDEKLQSLQDLNAQARRIREESTPPSLTPESDPDRGSAAAIVCLTDWHCGQVIDPDTVNGLNAYNRDIAKIRIERAFQKADRLLTFAHHLSNIDECIVWLGGDMISGTIHPELLEGNDMGAVDSLKFFQDNALAGLQFLLNHSGIKRWRLVTNNGNHSRLTTKKHISTAAQNNLEMMAYLNLAQLLRPTPYEVQIGTGYHNILDVKGWPVRTSHGDAIRYNGGVGGLTVPARKKIASWNRGRRAHLDIFGHFHTYLDHDEFLSVGCLCGYDAYAHEIGADYQPPTQGFCVVDRDRGKVLACKIFLEPKERRYA